ncbi:MAG: acyltransferase [Acetobacter sp.]|nr:acyltransferase [Bacteroides sp.]MCM1341130.1 acyltransferase [Acetobacter sp.]MCM1433536.1 acyltransferase [Clostridiales bacterium]
MKNSNDLTAKKKARNSNIEIVRIFAMLMIIASHIYGTNSGEEFQKLPQVIFVFTQSVFSAGLGVIIFMLISGYFLINSSAKRLTKMISMTWCCSVFAMIVGIVVNKLTNENISLMSIVKHIIPISSRYYWYISCYICVMILAPFFNKAINAMSKKDFQKLIIAMLAIFYIMPTFLYFDIMNDRGKGLVTMISAYFIGAYLSKYRIQLNKNKAAVLLLITFAVTFVGNYAATLVRGETSYPFSRECTITTLAAGILILHIATENTYENRVINALSSKTLYIYIISGTVTNIISRFEITTKYQESIWLVFLMLAMSIAVFALCYLLALVLQYPALLLDKILYSFIEKVTPYINKISNKIGIKNENSCS